MNRFWTAAVARRRALVLLFLTVLVPLVAIGELAEDVWDGAGLFFDRPILEALHARATPTLDATMLFFSHAGAPKPMVAFFIVILIGLLIAQRRGDALFFAIAVAGAMAINFGAKLLFGRARPDLWVSLAPESDYSFPSGHAMGSMAMIAALVVLTWGTRWRWPVLILGGLFVTLVGLSRLYLGVHYPSDVLTGWLASLAWVGGSALIRSSTFLRTIIQLRRATATKQQHPA
ncbi:MAG TPA: phosphatase PAP2 family protein [Thermomicrobiales bacterium]|jgi:undecaprenyl-diphosphatase